VLLAAAVGVFAGWGASRWIDIPRVEVLETWRPDVVTEVRAADGSVIGRFAIERRILLAPDRIPLLVRHAILAIEDHRFYEHGGIDPVRLAQAGLHDIRTGSKAQGASTITQQLAKMLFLTPEKTFRRKVNEMLLSFEIERRFSKDQILAMYANQVYLGHGNYGVEAAARDYFGKPAAKLVPEEAALLAGLIQRPEYYNPAIHPDRAKSRRNLVLGQMAEKGWLSPKEAEEAAARPILLPGPVGVEVQIGSHFTEDVRQQIEKDYGVTGLYRAGLRVETTLDPILQRAAEQAVKAGTRALAKRGGWRGPIEHVELAAHSGDGKKGGRKGGAPPKEGDGAPELPTLPEWKELLPADGLFARAIVVSADRKGAKLRVAKESWPLALDSIKWTWKPDPSFLRPGDVVAVRFRATKGGGFELGLEAPPACQGALIAIENKTGAIRALVGGEDFRESKFDRATQAKRQAGSAFKPFIYLTAFEKGYTAADTIFDAPVTFTAEKGLPPYTPHNYYKKSYGIQTFQRALELSHNVCAVKLLMMLGPAEVIERARRLGLEADFKPWPSMALGAFEVSLFDMTSAYSVFPSQGIWQKPYFIERIVDSDGRILEERIPDPKEIVSPQVAFQMVELLTGVVERGTATAAKKLGLPVAGKTGTTDDYSDAWFVGFTPTMTIGVWVGHDTKKTLGKGMTGGKAALPIWIDVVESLKARTPSLADAKWETPPRIIFTPVDLETGLVAEPGCAKVALIPTPPGQEPAGECSPRWDQISALPASLQRRFYQPKPGEVMTIASYVSALHADEGENVPADEGAEAGDN
jgi:penicillin-binding protein 1A